MPTRNVVVTDHQAQLIERLVGSGRYQNASEVLRVGLRLIESREAEDKTRLKALRDAEESGFPTLTPGVIPPSKSLPRCDVISSPWRSNIGQRGLRHPREVIARACRWTVRLTAAAEADFQAILRWSAGEFAQRQAGAYA